MRLELDGERCTGHGRCYTLAPDVFGSDDAGYSVLLIEGEVPEELQAAGRRAALNCPEGAITVVE